MWHNFARIVNLEVQKLNTEVFAKDWNGKQTFTVNIDLFVYSCNSETYIEQ